MIAPGHAPTLPKCPTGIAGLDEITQGGLPRGRPTLVCGGAGCGKTFLAMNFLVLGATRYDEPGVFMSFEERAQDLAQNFASLGFDIDALAATGKLAVDYVFVERAEIEETGEYDLEGLFIRLGYAIDRVGAKRVVLDTIESLFSGFSNESILRAELRRLFRWLKDKGVTAVITGEAGIDTLTRNGLEEYVSDCVIVLDHRVSGQVSTRRLRIAKYRGSAHGTNEYPFLMSSKGISVLPITSVGLEHVASSERISTGIARLDTMLGGQGYYRGSSVLVSGSAGTGKSTFAAHFVAAACARGEKALYFAFEESISQIVRNMRSVGTDLQPFLDAGLLRFHAGRATSQGLESHLVGVHDDITDFRPAVAAFDPVTNLLTTGQTAEVKTVLTRIIDFLKVDGITALFTSLTGKETGEHTELEISSLMDTWLLLRDMEANGERNRGLYVLKSRGMAHSNQVREFRLTDDGVRLMDVYAGTGEVVMGTARAVQEAEDEAAAVKRGQEAERLRRMLERKEALVAAQVAALRSELENEKDEIARSLTELEAAERVLASGQAALTRMRRANGSQESGG